VVAGILAALFGLGGARVGSHWLAGHPVREPAGSAVRAAPAARTTTARGCAGQPRMSVGADGSLLFTPADRAPCPSVRP
jgi:hypothetical protein